MKRFALFLSFLVLACGDSPAEPEPLSTVLAAADLAIISGDLQTDTILARLTEPLEVKLTDDAGLPIADAPIRFVVTEDGCGDAFLGHSTTDDLGEASDVWDLGTLAGECVMEVRALDENDTPRIVETFTATVRPGAPVESFYWFNSGGQSDTDSLVISPTGEIAATILDQAGNSVPWTAAIVEAGPATLHDRGDHYVLLPNGLGVGGQLDVSTDAGLWISTDVYTCEIDSGQYQGRLNVGWVHLSGSGSDPPC